MKNRAEDINSTKIEGRNAVREAYKSGLTVDKLYVQDGLRDDTVRQILSMAKDAGSIVNFVKREALDKMSESRVHQGVIAVAAAIEYSTVDEILELAKQRDEKPLVVIADEIEDPHNLGAIIRSANAAGAHGVIIPKRHAATVTATCAKASAGAVFDTKIARVTNIANTIEELKEKGLWIACTDMDGDIIYDADLKGALGIVIGNEGNGVRRMVKEKCDFVVSIPMIGSIESLNASVAAGVVLYEAVRQRKFT